MVLRHPRATVAPLLKTPDRQNVRSINEHNKYRIADDSFSPSTGEASSKMVS